MQKWGERIFSSQQLDRRVSNRIVMIMELDQLTSPHKKILVVTSTMFPYRNIHKYTWTSPDGKTHNQIDQVLIDRRWHLSVLDVRNFRGADCDTDHYLVIAKVRERLAVGKQATQRSDRQRFNLRKLNSQRLGNSIKLRLQTGLQLWRI